MGQVSGTLWDLLGQPIKSILWPMSRKPKAPPMLLEKRTGRSDDEHSPEELSFEEALERFIATQAHVNEHSVFKRMGANRPEGVGSDGQLGQAGVIFGHSAEYYAALLVGPELERAVQTGAISQEISEQISALAAQNDSGIARSQRNREID